jgi:hypothetical protein
MKSKNEIFDKNEYEKSISYPIANTQKLDRFYWGDKDEFDKLEKYYKSSISYLNKSIDNRNNSIDNQKTNPSLAKHQRRKSDYYHYLNCEIRKLKRLLTNEEKDKIKKKFGL